MLGQHFDDFAIAYAVIEIVAQLCCKGIEGCLLSDVGRVFQNDLDAVDVGIGDLGNIVGPVFPVVAVTAFLHHLGVYGAL
ncbi:hypothetical protein D9M71_730980 [compost metagenome]